jgi:hypothetical protein
MTKSMLFKEIFVPNNAVGAAMPLSILQHLSDMSSTINYV